MKHPFPTKQKARGVFDGTNFMTPTPVCTGRVAEGVWYEISKGRGMDNEPIFGVTIRGSRGEKLETPKGKLVYSMGQAIDYVNELANPDES